MNPNLAFCCVFIVLTLIFWLCNKYFNLLKDVSDAVKKPYSYSRVQLAYWTIIILSCFISIYLVTGQIPDFNNSSLILLGISAGTTVTASLIDVSDQSKNIHLSQDDPGKNLFLDILSDKNGISINRLQTVIFNMVFGFWFMQNFLHNINTCYDIKVAVNACNGCIAQINQIIPIVTPNNLILLGASSGTYAALKTNENKPGMTSAPNSPNASPPAA